MKVIQIFFEWKSSKNNFQKQNETRKKKKIVKPRNQ